jgi:hypothetical protein
MAAAVKGTVAGPLMRVSQSDENAFRYVEKRASKSVGAFDLLKLGMIVELNSKAQLLRLKVKTVQRSITNC